MSPTAARNGTQPSQPKTTTPVTPATSLLPEEERRRFHIGATDERGHSTRTQVRCTQRLLNQIDSVLGSKLFPYRSIGYLIRHAIVRHLHWLRELSLSTPETGGKVFTELGQIDAILAFLQEQEDAEKFLGVIDKSVTIVNSFLVQGDLGQARKYVLGFLDKIRKMPESYWQRKYLQAANQRLWALVDHQPGTDLTQPGEEGDLGEDVGDLGEMEETTGA